MSDALTPLGLTIVRTAVQQEIDALVLPSNFSFTPSLAMPNDANEILAYIIEWGEARGDNCGWQEVIDNKLDLADLLGGWLSLLVKNKKGEIVVFACNRMTLPPTYELQVMLYPQTPQHQLIQAICTQGVPAVRAFLRLHFTHMVVPDLPPNIHWVADDLEASLPLVRRKGLGRDMVLNKDHEIVEMPLKSSLRLMEGVLGL